MKIKNLVLRKLLLKVLSKLEKISNRLKKYKGGKKKLTKKDSKLITSIVEDYNNEITKINNQNTTNKILIVSVEQLEFYYDDCKGNIKKMELDELVNTVKKDVKSVKEKVIKTSDKIIDEYSDGKKFIVDNMIKNVYFKAKKLVLAINGALLRVNEEYRKVVDRFLEIRQTIINQSYTILKENKFLLKFVLDNNINTDKEFDECAEILTKMYISEKEADLYSKISSFTDLFNERTLSGAMII